MIFYYHLSLTIALALSSLISIPYLRRSFDDDFETDTWRDWLKLFLFISGFLNSSLVIFNFRWNFKWLLISSSSYLGLNLAWCIYYITFGLIVVSVQLATDNKDPSMLSEEMTCLEPPSLDYWESFLYVSSLFFMLTSMALIGDVYLRKLLGANSISKVDKRNEQRGDSFYVHDNLNETKIAPTARPDKFVTPVKDTASLVPRDTSPGPRKTPDIKTNSPGRGRGRGRGGRA